MPMNNAPVNLRGRAELAALAGALSACGGRAPAWLMPELAALPARREAPAGPDDYRGHMRFALALGGLLAAFIGGAGLAEDARFYPAPRAARIAADAGALEAIALVQDWQPAGDEKPVLSRLAGAVRNPAYPRAWTAERTEAGTYLVIFREPAGTPAYAFEVRLESESVEATPEAVERLTTLRLRENADADALAAAQSAALVARVH